MKRVAIFGALSVALLLFSSCGYRVGSVMHPQVKTIGIANVINETNAYNVSVQLQQLMSEQFMLDGSLKVTDRAKSDCVIYAKIVDVAFSEVAGANSYDNNSVYKPKIWQVRVSVNFSVIIPGRGEPMIPLTAVSGTTEFQSYADQETHRTRAITQAIRDAAQKIVQATTEAW